MVFYSVYVEEKRLDYNERTVESSAFEFDHLKNH